MPLPIAATGKTAPRSDSWRPTNPWSRAITSWSRPGVSSTTSSRPTRRKPFWEGLRSGVATIEQTTSADLEAAWAIGQGFADQDFSLVGRTSFALMERLGITRVISFDDDFAIFRYGRGRNSAFELLR